MLIAKKLVFAPFFIILYALLLYKFAPIAKSYDFIFSLSLDGLIQLVTLTALFCAVSLFFVLFATLSQDWKFVSATGILVFFLPMLFFRSATGLVLAVGCLIALILTFVNLENKLKSYLTFDAYFLIPAIKGLITFLILSFCFVYFLSINQIISKSGFQIPDSLIDAALKFTPQQSSQSLTNDLLKPALKTQIQDLINPYLTFLPAILAVLLFFTLQSLSSLISLSFYPLLWLIFYILEKSGFVRFEIEQRPVRKMVI